MSGGYNVVWSNIAEADLRNILNYLARDRYQAAVHIFQCLKEIAATLETHPSRCRVVPELAAINLENYRELTVNPYRVIFRIEGRKVFIIGAFDGRRELEQILVDRIINFRD